MKYDEAEQQWQYWNNFSLTGIMVLNDQHAIPSAIVTTEMNDESAEGDNFEDIRTLNTSEKETLSERETSETKNDEETVIDTKAGAETGTAKDTKPQVRNEVIPGNRLTIAVNSGYPDGREEDNSLRWFHHGHWNHLRHYYRPKKEQEVPSCPGYQEQHNRNRCAPRQSGTIHTRGVW